MGKLTKITMLAIGISLSFTAISYAGQWKHGSDGYWWQDEDGSYPVNTWRWLDGNQDGISKCYYFDENGYRLANV